MDGVHYHNNKFHINATPKLHGTDGRWDDVSEKLISVKPAIPETCCWRKKREREKKVNDAIHHSIILQFQRLNLIEDTNREKYVIEGVKFEGGGGRMKENRIGFRDGKKTKEKKNEKNVKKKASILKREK